MHHSEIVMSEPNATQPEQAISETKPRPLRWLFEPKRTRPCRGRSTRVADVILVPGETGRTGGPCPDHTRRTMVAIGLE
jgi:hypothetical protein